MMRNRPRHHSSRGPPRRDSRGGDSRGGDSRGGDSRADSRDRDGRYGGTRKGSDRDRGDRGDRDRPRRGRSSRSRSPRRDRRGGDRSRSPRPRRYSASPERERKKKKKVSNWDIAPDENAAKAPDGTPALPGVVTPAVPGVAPGGPTFVPGIQVQLPDGTQGSMDAMMGWQKQLSSVQQAPAFNTGAGFMHIIRQARRLYVGNLPLGTTQVGEDDLKAFFNATMVEVQGENRPPGDSVLSVYINHQRRFGFIEFRTMEEATAAMALDGIMFRGDSLRIGRPANYDPTMLPKENNEINGTTSLDSNKLNQLGIVSNQVTDGPDKIFCGGLPFELGEDQVKELLSTYGRLKSFHLVKDMHTGVSKGFCFFKYQDASVTTDAIQGLNGIQIGDRTLTVRRHQPKQEFQNPNQDVLTSGYEAGAAAAEALKAQGGIPETPTNVLCLMQMVTPDDLKDDAEYKEILDDTKEECSKYGVVQTIKMPRPGSDPTEEVHGVGKVYVEFQDIEHAQKARTALEGRTFDNRTVLVSFYDLEKYTLNNFADA